MFHEALERPPADRDRFVREAAADDAELRDEVIALLSAQTRADAGFSGWISVEDGMNGLDELRRSVEFLKAQRAVFRLGYDYGDHTR